MRGPQELGLKQVKAHILAAPQVLYPGNCRGDGALIAALVRQTREQLGLDLGACRRWRRLVEVHYARPVAGIPSELQRVRFMDWFRSGPAGFKAGCDMY